MGAEPLSLESHRSTTMVRLIQQLFRVKALLVTSVVTLCLIAPSQAQVDIVRLDSTRLDRANIWGVLADAPSHMAITTAQAQHIYLRYLDSAMQEVDVVGPDPVRLTFDADGFGQNGLPTIADHKTLFWRGHYYVTFSLAGDRQLYLMKVTPEGNRVGDILKVYDQDEQPAGQPGLPTNDMILGASENTLYVGHFAVGIGHRMHSFDPELNRTRDPFNTDPSLVHNNVGGLYYQASERVFYLVTGDKFGGATAAGGGMPAQEGANLILTKWDEQFEPLMTAPQVIIDDPAEEGSWFGTGVAQDTSTGFWYVAFQHLNEGEKLDEEHVDLAVYDADFKTLITRSHETAREYFRPHLHIYDGALFMSYDRRGNGVFVHKYELLEEGDAPTNSAPVAAFTASQTSGQAPVSITFDASGSSDPDGDALTFAWDFGDGATAQGQQVVHTYTAFGDYDVTLTVSDGMAADSDAVTISIASGVSTASETIPEQFELQPPFPNPFSDQTTITYALREPALVDIRLTDALGRIVARPVVGQMHAAGLHEVTLRASGLVSGTYMITLQTGTMTQSRSLIVVR